MEASLDPPPNFRAIARSPVLTAWKRGYIEYDRMFKAGEFINQTSGAGQANPTFIFVVNPGIFHVGDDVHVISGGNWDTQEGELRKVTSVASDHIVVDSPLKLTYPCEHPEEPSKHYPFSFVGREGDGAFDLSPSLEVIASVFDDPFMEWQFSDGSSFLPTLDLISKDDIDPLSCLFFKHFDFLKSKPEKNHIQLVAAGSINEPKILGRANGTNGSLTASNWAWVFTLNIENFCSGCDFSRRTNVTNDVICHELGHQWNVNPPDVQTNGHDSEKAWNSTLIKPRLCLMNEDRPHDTFPITRFHSHLDSGVPLDLYCIRGHVGMT